MPLLGWALQEATERLLGVESFPFAAEREPAFLKGLVVQVLFGVLALLLARLLLACISELRRHRQLDWGPQQPRDGAAIAPARRVVPRWVLIEIDCESSQRCC